MSDQIEHESHREDLPQEGLIKKLLGLKWAEIVGMRVALGALIILLVTAIAYSNALWIPFHDEDRRVIVANPGLHTISDLSQAAELDLVQKLHLRPLTLLSLAASWRLAPHSALGFHAFNILLHGLTGVLVYLLSRRVVTAAQPEPGIFNEAVALIGGMLFVLHPATTESVNSVVQRGGLIATPLMLVSMLLFLRATEPHRPIAFAMAAVSAVFFVCAWAASETALLLPVLLLAADWVLRGRTDWTARAPIHLAFWGLLGAMLAVHQGSQLSSQPQMQPSGPTMLVQSAATLRSAELVVTGRGLSVAHPDPASLFARPYAILAAGLTVLVVVAVLVLLTRRVIPGLALFWFLVTVPTLPGFPSENPLLSERRLYLALAGAVLLVPWALALLGRLRSLRLAAAVAALALLATAGAGTYIRNATWLDEFALWQDAALVAPGSATVHRQLGRLHLEEGRALLQQLADGSEELDTASRGIQRDRAMAHIAAAETHLQNADALEAKDPETVFLMGTAAALLGKTDDAHERFLDALRVDLSHFESTLALARLLQRRANETQSTEDFAGAVAYYERAARLGRLPGPDSANYGMALVGRGDYEMAESILSQTVADETSLSSQAAEAIRSRFEEVQRTAGQLRALRQQIARLEQEAPDTVHVARLQAQAFLLQRQFLWAAYLLDQVLAREPEDARAWALLGFAKAQLGSSKQFLAEWPRPPKAGEGEPSPWLQMAQMCAAAGNWEDAQVYLKSNEAGEDVQLPLVVLAEVALTLAQPDLAREFLRQAAETYKNEPTAWLRLCDLALSQRDYSAAGGYLAEAEKQGAAESEMVLRREKLREIEEVSRPPAVIIR